MKKQFTCTFNSKIYIIASLGRFTLYRGQSRFQYVFQQRTGELVVCRIYSGDYSTAGKFYKSSLSKETKLNPSSKVDRAQFYILRFLFKASRIIYKGCHFSMMSVTFLKINTKLRYICKTYFEHFAS